MVTNFNVSLFQVYYTRELVKSGVTRQKILVLSPYKAQCYYVKEELKKHGLADVAVMTVVASQGLQFELMKYTNLLLTESAVVTGPRSSQSVHHRGLIFSRNDQAVEVNKRFIYYVAFLNNIPYIRMVWYRIILFKCCCSCFHDSKSLFQILHRSTRT